VEKCCGRNGHLKTFGFVGFTDDNNAEKAMENFHGFEFDGRHIHVEFVRPHSEIIQTFRQKQDSPTAHSTAVLGVESDNDDGSDDSSGDDDDTGDDSHHTDNGIPQKSFDVLVGKEPNQQRFTVYHDLLTQRSDFFRAARSEHWVTKPNQPTTLDDHEPATFSLYLHCVNFGAEALEEHIDAMAATSSSGSDSNSDSDSDSGSPSESDGDRKNDRGEGDAEDDDTEGKSNINNTGGDGTSECDSSNSGDAESRWLGHAGKRLVDLYLLADKLLDPTTADMAIDKWIRMAEAKDMYASYNMISYVYSSTTAGSPLRRLIRDWYVYTVEKMWAEDLRCCDFPHEFLQDIILEMYARQRENGEEDLCDCFWDDKLVDRPKDHYHQKLGKPLSEAASPKPDQK
jgi:hypothetical protein